MSMFFCEILNLSQILRIFAKDRQLSIIFISNCRKNGFEVSHECLCLVQFLQFGLFLFVVLDILVGSACRLIDIDTFFGNEQLDEMVDIDRKVKTGCKFIDF
jgi:hypothetical protein